MVLNKQEKCEGCKNFVNFPCVFLSPIEHYIHAFLTFILLVQNKFALYIRKATLQYYF